MPNDFQELGAVLQLDRWVGDDVVVPVPIEEVLQPLQAEATEVPSATAPAEDDGLVFDEEISIDDFKLAPSPPPAARARPSDDGPPANDDDEDDPTAFMSNMGLTQQREVPDITKPWMRYHKFVRVKTIEELNAIIDQSLVTKHCALDLETQGLDTRVYWKRPAEIKGAYEVWWEGDAPEFIQQTVHKIVGYCLSPDGETGYYVPVRHTAEDSPNLDIVEVGKAIQRLCLLAQPILTEEGKRLDPLGSPLIQTPGRVKILFWSAKFDQEFLFPVTGIDFWHPESFEDSMYLYFCRYTNDKNLSLKVKSNKELVVKDAMGTPLRLNNLPITYEMIELKDLFIRGRKIDFASLHPDEPGVLKYACSDAICTYKHGTKPDLKSMIQDPLYASTYRLEKQTAQALRIMERPRLLLDMPYVRSLFEEARIEADKYREQIVALARTHNFHGFDPQSTQQLAAFLFSDPTGLNLEPKPEQTATGQYKTDADTLEKLVEENPGTVNPILLTIVKFRQVEKVIGTYLTAMVSNCDHNDEARVQFKQHGAATGRISAPAGQPEHGFAGFPPHGIPSGYDESKPKVATALRKAFKARPGYTMVKVDFAGEELRIATNLSREPIWIKEFKEGSGDLHSITARAFFGKTEVSKQERQQGKIANFSLVYGGGVQAIMRATGCNQVEAARRKANFDKTLATFAGWVKGQKAKVHKDKGIKTPFGRWIAIPEIDSPDKPLVGAAERWSINYPIQGAGADIMKMALVLLVKEFHRRGWHQANIARMLLTVHDEIVFEVKHEYLQEIVPVIEHLMTEPGRMARWEVPLEVEPLIDLTWDAKYDFHKIMRGEHKPPKEGDKPLKASEIRVGDRIYTKVPHWLEGLLTPDYMRDGVDLPKEATVMPPPPPAAPPPAPNPEQAPKAPSKPVEAAEAKPEGVPPSNPAPPSSKPPSSKTEVYVTQTAFTTASSVRIVGSICWRSLDLENGKILHLLDAKTGETLIDPTLRVMVNPEQFQRFMKDHNL